MAMETLATGDPGAPPSHWGERVSLPPSCPDAIFDAINARCLQYLQSFHLNYIIK